MALWPASGDRKMMASNREAMEKKYGGPEGYAQHMKEIASRPRSGGYLRSLSKKERTALAALGGNTRAKKAKEKNDSEYGSK